MFKKNISLTIILFFLVSSRIYTQTTDVITNLTAPSDMVFNGNFLYFINSATILKIDVTTANPQPITVATGLTSPQSLAIKDNYLYVVHGDKISKVNMSAPTPSIVTDVITGIEFSSSIMINGNDLYISFWNVGKISKIDLTQSNPELVDILTGIDWPIPMAMIGNDLYFSSVVSSNIQTQAISKIDITQLSPPTLVVNGVYDPKKFIILGNRMLFSEIGGGRISYIDITQANPEIIEVANVPFGPSGIALFNNILYISTPTVGKIIKLDAPLSINSPYETASKKILLFPNPAENEVQITGIDFPEKYAIYNCVGQLISHGIVQDARLDIKDLRTGLYFVKFGDSATLKLLKK